MRHSSFYLTQKFTYSNFRAFAPFIRRDELELENIALVTYHNPVERCIGVHINISCAFNDLIVPFAGLYTGKYLKPCRMFRHPRSCLVKLLRFILVSKLCFADKSIFAFIYLHSLSTKVSYLSIQFTFKTLPWRLLLPTHLVCDLFEPCESSSGPEKSRALVSTTRSSLLHK